MILIMVLACAFAALVCYSSCYVAARADEKSENIGEKRMETTTTTSKTIKINNLATDEGVTNPKLYGWICPVCGRGNSPFTSTCPCKPFDYKINWGPATVTWSTSATGGTINETR